MLEEYFIYFDWFPFSEPGKGRKGAEHAARRREGAGMRAALVALGAADCADPVPFSKISNQN